MVDMQLNYNHLRYFWAVAHEGNLTQTAVRLNLSQSALSLQIRKLEHQLGHALFERRGRRLHLTEAGRVTLDHANTIFAAGDELLSTLHQTGVAREAVRVGALATLSRNFQLSFLKPLLGRMDIEIVLRSGSAAELLLGLQALTLDVVLTNEVPASDALTPFVAHKIAEQPVSLIGAPHLRSEPASIEGLLATHPVILPTRLSSVRTGFDAFADRLDILPQIAAEVDDIAMMRLLVREGFALAVLPPIAVRDELAAGTLVEFDSLLGLTESFYAVTVKRRFPKASIRQLLDSVIE
ncbi:LysR family transcriptional regulator [Sphingomonas sanguinis]|uniref:LysR family transcriptional regulator n=1 Tax=Sphingomonas sanguinis TaxID=33051 RepID=A0ABU5LL09_9SPHN|nr:LysR family transcriptional regulator [Sphingomonas sanguinis]MDZ7280421.1 LysR family transcriptional regulator [Sphingomonas sanguinis]QXT36089.1 LysR family transcriptional regulator [Sphingomonas sanguinis]